MIEVKPVAIFLWSHFCGPPFPAVDPQPRDGRVIGLVGDGHDLVGLAILLQLAGAQVFLRKPGCVSSQR